MCLKMLHVLSWCLLCFHSLFPCLHLLNQKHRRLNTKYSILLYMIFLQFAEPIGMINMVPMLLNIDLELLGILAVFCAWECFKGVVL